MKTNGKSFARMLKTVATVTDAVPVAEDVMAIDKQCIQIIEVSRQDEKPIFGGVALDKSLDVKTASKMKLTNVSFDMELSEDGIRLNEEHGGIEHIIPLRSETVKRPKRITVEGGSFVDKLEIKTLLDAVTTHKRTVVKIYSQSIGDGLYDTFADVLTEDGTKLTHARIGRMDGVEGAELQTAIFSCDILAKILKHVPDGMCMMWVKKDAPLELKWWDTEYEYRYLLAPRIEPE